MKEQEIQNKLHEIYDLVNIETCWLEIALNYIDSKEDYDFNLLLILDKLQAENKKLFKYIDELLIIT